MFLEPLRRLLDRAAHGNRDQPERNEFAEQLDCLRLQVAVREGDVADVAVVGGEVDPLLAKITNWHGIA